jgi:transcriptional regulator GlxA family with amidase domain
MLVADTTSALERFEAHSTILSVIQYFAEHFSTAVTVPQLSRDLRIPLLQIETAFDLCKGKTANQALLEYRLSRLCDLMSFDPVEEIGIQLRRCGLGFDLSSDFAIFHRTNEQFISCFGIDLVEYHQQCFIASAVRLQASAQALASSTKR